MTAFFDPSVTQNGQPQQGAGQFGNPYPQIQAAYPQLNTPAPVAKRWDPPKPHSNAFYFVVVTLLTVSVLALLSILPQLTYPAGVDGMMKAATYAIIPLAFTTAFVLWIDAWEPEPKWLYLVALGWGGGVAVMLSAWLNTWWLTSFGPMVLGDDASQFDLQKFAVSYGAPIVEELMKGLGVILIFFLFKQHFNGPVDGIVYGALIGAGFAFTENILYLARYSDHMSEVFNLRFVEGPFSHDVYTAFFGFFIGFVEYSRKRMTVFLWLIPAMLGAGFFHWTNNAGTFWNISVDTYKMINNVPVLILIVAAVLFSRSYERKAVLGGLKAYEQAGWLARHEVQSLETFRGRRMGQTWAEKSVRSLGGPGGAGTELMKAMQTEMIQLGHDRTRTVRRGIANSPESRAAEARQLELISRLRTSMTTAA